MIDNNRAAKSIGWRQYRDLFERSEPQDPDACARFGQWIGLAGLSVSGHSDAFAGPSAPCSGGILYGIAQQTQLTIYDMRRRSVRL